MSFDDQLVGRSSILLLWNNHVKKTGKKSRKQERYQRSQDLQSKVSDHDNVSVRSSWTTPSNATAINSEAPDAAKTPDNTDDADGKTCHGPFLVPCFSISKENGC